MLFLGCLGSAAFHPKGASVTPVLSGSRPEMGMAIFSATGNLGFAAGPTVIGVLHRRVGMGRLPRADRPRRGASSRCSSCCCRPAASRSTRRAGTEITLRGLVADRAGFAAVLRLVFINFCLTVGLRGLQTFLGIHLADLGQPLKSVGLLLTATLALGALASIFVSSLSRTDRLPGARGLLDPRRSSPRAWRGCSSCRPRPAGS